MRGAGFLAIWSDVERSNLTDYRHWLTREHTTERVTTDGFLANPVFRAVRDDLERFHRRDLRSRALRLHRCDSGRGAEAGQTAGCGAGVAARLAIESINNGSGG